MTYYTLAFNRYFDFDGRSNPPEFWYFNLFNLLVTIVLASIMEAVPALAFLYYVYGVVTVIPSLSVSVRRLHDVGKSGWNLLWILTGIGGIYVLYLWTKPSEPGARG